MYKCVDERGKINYTDKPQASCKETAIKPSRPLSGEVRPRRDDFANDDAAFKRRQLFFRRLQLLHFRFARRASTFLRGIHFFQTDLPGGPAGKRRPNRPNARNVDDLRTFAVFTGEPPSPGAEP